MNPDEQKNALVTGCTCGIGEAFSKKLLSEGFEVYGIGRDFSKCTIENEHFHAICADLRNSETVTALPEVSALKHRLDLLVNNAGCACYGPHEELSPAAVSDMVSVNLTAPMVLTGFFLRTLKERKGTVLNVSSVTATHAAVYGAAYGATKAGLSAFSKSLFEECRKTGVRVITVQPDLTDTDLYRNASFSVSDAPDERLTAEDVSDAMWYAVSLRNGIDLTELTVRPQKNRIVRKKPDGTEA